MFGGICPGGICRPGGICPERYMSTVLTKPRIYFLQFMLHLPCQPHHYTQWVS